MNRNIIYAGAIPLDTDSLQLQKNIQQALGYVMQAAFGTTTVCDGLTISPTSPASLSVNIALGSIIAYETTDTTAYGSLPVDNNYIMKIGINNTPTQLTFAAPTVSGTSINYLVECCFSENDIDPVVLPYFNAANPSMVFSGPNNDGLPNNTIRADTVSIRFKAGNQSTSGTQNTPIVDAGYVALGLVTVAYGQTTITASSITNYLTTRVGTKLSQQRTKLTQNLTLYCSNSGASTNSGLSVNDPLDTPQDAWNLIINDYDLNGYSVTVNILAGTYPALTAAGQPQGFGANSSILFIGAGATTILNSSGLVASVGTSNGASIEIQNMYIEGSIGIDCMTGSSVAIMGGVTFGNCSASHIISAGVVTIFGNYTISGGANAHWSTAAGGFIDVFNAPVISGTGAQAFTTAFAYCNTGSISVQGLTFSGCGSFTGVRYNAAGGGYINTQTGNTSFLPGNTAGTVNTGTTYSGYYS